MADTWSGRLAIMQECVASAKKMLAGQSHLLEQVSPSLQTVRLADLIQQAVSSIIRPTATFSITDAPSPIEAKVDVALMGEVFQELALNAKKAAGDNVTIAVIVCQTMGRLPARDGEYPIVRIEFFNRGPCVPDEMLEKVFAPGVVLDKRRGGFGLGLSIMRRFVEAHGGSLVAEPCKEGFKVIITIPL
jgi:two-component system sensor histidine kinase RstB